MHLKMHFLVALTSLSIAFSIKSHAADFVRIQYKEDSPRIHELNWEGTYFDTSVEKSPEGRDQPYALLTGSFHRPDWILMPTQSQNRILFINNGDSSKKKLFILAVPLNVTSNHVELQAVNTYGETETEEFDLILTPGLLNFWEKRIRIQSPFGTFQEKASIGSTSTQIAGNIFRFAGDLVYYRAETKTDATLESMLSLGGGYMLAGEELSFPFLWNGSLQILWRNLWTFNSNHTFSISPLLKIEGESYSTISNQLTAATYNSARSLSYQSRTFNLYWVGIGFRIRSEDETSWWEISPAYFQTLSSHSFLSSSSDLYSQSGSKFSLQTYFQLGTPNKDGSRIFLGIDSSYIKLSGGAEITGIEASGVIGYRF